ncbi:MAG: hypothetical protein U0Q21_09310 [Dermatophilaceae bacterium]
MRVVGQVVSVRIHPVKDDPGIDLEHVRVGNEGLDGDRRKKAPVHLVGSDAAQTRANLVLDVPSADLDALVGRSVTVGGTVLGVTRTAGNCLGVYAEVRVPGSISRGASVTTD